MAESGITRRPIAARNTQWAQSTAQWLTRVGCQPNAISLMSILFAVLAAGCLYLVPVVAWPAGKMGLYFAAAVCIPLRLLCNMFDGMVAVEGGIRSKVGDLYNEFPDRLSDVFVLVAAGFSTHTPVGIFAGWTCAVLAVLTAYIRALGGVTGVIQPFCGPMAKQQRMTIIVAASILSIGEVALHRSWEIMTIALFVILAGSVITCIRRLRRIAGELNSR